MFERGLQRGAEEFEASLFSLCARFNDTKIKFYANNVKFCVFG